MWPWKRSSRAIDWRRSLVSKLNPPVPSPPAREDLVDDEAHLLDGVRELVGVPPVLRVAPVGVDRSEHAGGDGGGDLVVEAVAGERGVVRLEVDLDLVQAVAGEEPGHGGGVVVVLVLGRLGRLRLDQDRALEPDAVLVLDHEVQEAGELVELTPQVGVEQRVVALPAAPQHVVLAAEAMGRLQRVRTPAPRRRRTPPGRGSVAAPAA